VLDVNFFDELRIGLATADDIRQWSHGEVKKPETINYRTLKPEKDGLFCEKIFGPTRDWECYCGKYKRVRFKGIICERCGVEVTRAKVRRERMGHIELAAPVTHIWYFKGVPSRLGYLLDLAPKDLEKVIYFAAYMITEVDDENRTRDLPSLEAKISVERQQIEQRRDADVEARQKRLEEDLAQLEAEGAKGDARRKVREGAEREMKQLRDRAQRELDRLQQVWDRFKNLKVQDLEGDEVLYREMRDRFGMYFAGGMGAAALQSGLESFDLEAEAEIAARDDRHRQGPEQGPVRLKRLKVVSAFLTTRNSPMGMVLDCVPGHPAGPAPDGAARRWPVRDERPERPLPPRDQPNNRLKRLLDLGAPRSSSTTRSGCCRRPSTRCSTTAAAAGRSPARATARSSRCPTCSRASRAGSAEPARQARRLLRPLGHRRRPAAQAAPVRPAQADGARAVQAVRHEAAGRPQPRAEHQVAKRMVERARPVVWDVLEEVITEHPVLLNRAPTLHRLGIQAFEPQLVEGKAIQIHPLVCTAFNADFDGDQMAVHLPLSAEAQAEARILMLSSNNILKPADGRPVTMPTQDMIIGLYHLTLMKPGGAGEGRVFSSVAEAIMAMDARELDLQAKVAIRFEADVVPPATWTAPEGWTEGDALVIETSLGRALFNEALPPDYAFVDSEVDKKVLSAIVNDLAERYPKVQVAATLDALKESGFHWATRSGVTVSISDVVTPVKKPQILERYEAKADKVQGQYERGLITDDERRQELIEIWTQATNEVAKEMEANLPKDNSIFKMVSSGARGNWMQMRQIAACAAWWPTPRARSSRARSRPTSVRACRCWSSSSPRTEPARDWPTPRCAPPTRLSDASSRRRRAGRHHPRGGLRHRARAWSCRSPSSCRTAACGATTTSRPASTPGPRPRTSPSTAPSSSRPVPTWATSSSTTSSPAAWRRSRSGRC
jgi:DNA-directed RNA polymerase subunit beta'